MLAARHLPRAADAQNKNHNALLAKNSGSGCRFAAARGNDAGPDSAGRWLAILLLCLVCPHSSQSAERENLIAVYVYRLAERIQWPDQESSSSFEFLIIDENNSVATALTEISRQRTLHGKQFKVRYSKHYEAGSAPQVIFLGREKLELYSDIYSRSARQPVLIISEGLGDSRSMMIDLSRKDPGVITFKMNKANLLNRQLEADADITLLGGTEVDIARLYREGQATLDQQNQKLEKLAKDIRLSEDYSEGLAASLKAAERRISEQEALVSSYTLDIQAMEKTLDRLAGEITTLSTERNALREREEQKRLRLEDMTAALNSKEEEFSRLQSRIAVSSRELEEYASRIDEQLATISAKEQEIDQLGVTVSSQNKYLLLAAFTAFLLGLLALTSYRAFKNRQRLNTTLTEYARELEHSKKHAEQSARAKTTFLSNMSHELRSPLTSIIGFSSLIKQNHSISDELREHVDIINRSGEHLLALINDVLDLSKVEISNIEIDQIDFDIYNLLEEVVEMMVVNAESKGLYLRYEIADDCPRHARGDETKLRRVLINLLSNAIKFTHQGGVFIRVESDLASDDRFTLRCHVEDSGIGILEQNMKELFLPFSQVHHEREASGTSKGTGLGLSLSKQLLEYMGGSIRVASQFGKGSIFTFELPLSLSSPAQVRMTHQEPPQIRAIKNSATPIKALVVEDIIESATYLRRVLESVGCHVTEAHSGIEAIEAFQNDPPDVIWMDRRMNQMDGLEATRNIRALPGGDDTVIVMVTASAFRDDKEKLLKMGLDDVVHKPYLPQEIYRCLEQLLQLEFEYEEVEGEFGTSDISYQTALETLSAMPEATLNELSAAFKSLDLDSSYQEIAKLDAEYDELAAELTRLAANFDFEYLQRLLAEAMARHTNQGDINNNSQVPPAPSLSEKNHAIES